MAGFAQPVPAFGNEDQILPEVNPPTLKPQPRITDPEPQHQHEPAQLLLHVGRRLSGEKYAYLTILGTIAKTERVVKPSADGKKLLDQGLLIRENPTYPRAMEDVYVTDRVSIVAWMWSSRFNGELWCPHEFRR